MNDAMITRALWAYLEGGLSIVPINPKTKRPFAKLLPQAVDSDGRPLFYQKADDESLTVTTADTGFPKGTWAPFQERRPTTEEAQRWLDNGIVSMAVVAGRVSGGVEILDFDVEGYYERWCEAVGDLADNLPVQQTGGGGIQVAWRCSDPEQNQKLAWHPDPSAHTGRAVAIETRGEGGYAVLPPSLHPSGNRYKLLKGRFSDIPHIAMSLRNYLLSCARQLCQAPKTKQDLEREALQEAEKEERRRTYDGESVIDAYNAKHGIEAVLTHYGYTKAHGGRWSRPGDTESAGVEVIKDQNKTYHYSSNDPLDSDSHGDHQPRAPFDYLLHFDYRGDYKAAVKAAALEMGIAKPVVYTNGHVAHGTNGAAKPGQVEEAKMENPDSSATELDVLKYRSEDGGILDAWLDMYGDDWLFSVGPDEWRYWYGTHWKLDDQLFIGKQVLMLMDTMNQTCSRIMQEAPGKIKAINERYISAGIEIPDSAIREIEKIKVGGGLAKTIHAATKRSSSRVASVETLAKKTRAMAVSKFDIDPSLNLTNGVLSLLSLELREHSKEELFTYCLGYTYDPNADCPLFKKFISEVLVKQNTEETDESLVLLFQELLGYSLTPDVKHEVMVWMYGDGSNGKSVAISIIEALLGPMALSLDFQTVGQPGNYDLADVPGKRVLFSTEAEKGKATAESYIKRIVTGDTLSARPIYGSTMKFKSTAKIWWAMNDRPIIKDTSDSMWRRMKLIPFFRKFIEGKTADPDLTQKLVAELPGILNWAIAGLMRLKTNNKFTYALASENAKAEYREEANPVSQWVNTMTIRTDYPATLAGALFEKFHQWCEQNNERTITSTQFGRDLTRLKVDSQKKMNGKMYHLALIDTSRGNP